jgi:DNA polymerase-3 subunit delta
MIHFYYGENDLGLKRQTELLTDKFSKKYGPENIIKIDAGSADSQNILSEIVNIGLFAMNRLVILNSAFENKELLKNLPDILGRVPEETELVIVSAKPDKRSKLFKILIKNHRSKEFPKIKNLEEFVRLEAENSRVEIKPNAVRELIVFCGGDTWRIVQEIAKFQALDKLVTVDLVHKIVEPELEASAFKLLDGLLNGRTEIAMAEFDKLRQTEDANRFLGLLASQIFALAVAVNAGGKTSAQVAQEMGLHPFMMSKMFEIARKLKPAQVAKMSQIVAETDAKLKTSGGEAWDLLKLAVAKL